MNEEGTAPPKAIEPAGDRESEGRDAAAAVRLFSWQAPGEEVVSLRRRHPYFLVTRLMIPAAILALPLALWIVGRDLGISLPRLVPWGYVVLGPAAGLLFFWFYVSWQNAYLAITTRRLVHARKPLWGEEIRQELLLEGVASAEMDPLDPVADTFGFGSLTVRSTGGDLVHLGGFEDPEEMQEELLAAAERSRRQGPDWPILVRPLVTEADVATRPGAGIRGPLFPRSRIEEDGLITLRKHWYVLLRALVAPAGLLVLLLEAGLGMLLGVPLLRGLPGDLGLSLTIAGSSLLALIILYRYEDWRNELFILTDERLIDVDKKPFLLREERREAALSRVQDVRYVVPGILANLLNVGNVVIETASSEGELTFEWIHDPRRVQRDIFERVEAWREQERREESRARVEELKQAFSEIGGVDPPASD